MNSTVVKDIKEAYNSVYYDETNLFEDIVNYCHGINIFETIEETEYFANLIIENELANTFVEDVLEYYSEEQLLDESYIAEVSAGLLKTGMKVAGGLLKKVTPAVRGLPAKTLAKKGYTPGGFSSTGKQLGKVNKPALATQTRSIQQARAARKPPEPQKANKYADMLAQKKASQATKPTAPKPATTKPGGMTPSYVAKRGITDTLATTLALGMGHMAGLKPATNVLKQFAQPIVRTIKPAATRTAPTALPSAGKTVASKPTFKPEALPKSPKLAEPAGKLATTKAPKPTFKPEALPKAKATTEPGGALVRVKGSKPTFKPEALPKAKATTEPGGALVSTRSSKPTFKPEALPKAKATTEPAGKLATTKTPKTTKTGLSPEGQAIQRLNKMTGGGPLGTRELPKLSPRAPKPAWEAGAKPPKPQQVPGQVQRSVALPSSKTISSVKPSKKTPEPSTGGKPPRGGGLTNTVRATLSPAERTGNMKYPGLEKYATGSGPGTGGAKPPKKSMLGPAVAAAGAALASSDSERKQKKTEKQQKALVSNIEKPKKKVTGEDVRKSFDTAFATERKLKGSKGTFRWTNPLTKKTGTYTTKMAKESIDNFDIILDSLLVEGYSNEDALSIMANLDEAAVTKLLLKLQKALPKLSDEGKKTARGIMKKQDSTAADLERQKMSPVRKQQSKQRYERETEDRYGHQSLSAAERNSSMR
jgi:hypothetical protein